MTIFEEIVNDKMNFEFTSRGLKPIYHAPTSAKIVIIGQAPGLRVQNSGIMWHDASGDRLREWMGISKDVFYNSGKIGVIPMDFYYPGKAKSGDLPPRKGIADKWHSRLLKQMPNIQMTILVGSYAQKYYLKLNSQAKITTVIKDYQKYLPNYFPIVHPSPRNNIWLKKNPWFEQKVVPDLQKMISQIISN
ncbi:MULTISPECIES: uracil-DNA glycosylase family protein [Leuconostoc]|uniref:Uracil-DNA glycosylase-like domain-containing protein n=3 Tax=Leuconostoc TaxID=1243 RepID=A0AAN2UH61_9LACO|nr:MULTISPECIES: uracil-DNA glycosylase family protein [Leuconostoc]MBZ5946459.1 uracil-DNA glycosylase family protein [Leuconostoc gasicomitatum]MBZ5948538.1 uracil-DNA glycosylase family protein [Leuconostoc gasicomitatum]MBZ5954254.1 uracil-DNA glycosylase family protein [Leuconostoc gasicomitatum]MBZ5957230.1 uracil-DNA glycosylase family protein [Leuconostoc gasicomitatum]MBZ5961046.1 uracil-DNA glycosylase family protein [Leuconostoc gasicomitatum]